MNRKCKNNATKMITAYGAQVRTNALVLCVWVCGCGCVGNEKEIQNNMWLDWIFFWIHQPLTQDNLNDYVITKIILIHYNQNVHYIPLYLMPMQRMYNNY